MTNRELDIQIAEKIYKTVVHKKHQVWGHRIDYVAADQEANDPIISMEMIDGYQLKKFSTNIEDAWKAAQKLNVGPEGELFRVIIDNELKDGVVKWTAFINGTARGEGSSAAYALAQAALFCQEHSDMPPEPELVFESKDIFLKKDGEKGVIGLHEVGLTFEGQWHREESWGNQYDDSGRFQYSAFRIFGSIEVDAAEMKKAGWVEVPDFKVKK
jgi:hypothetical protein